MSHTFPKRVKLISNKKKSRKTMVFVFSIVSQKGWAMISALRVSQTRSPPENRRLWERPCHLPWVLRGALSVSGFFKRSHFKCWEFTMLKPFKSWHVPVCCCFSSTSSWLWSIVFKHVLSKQLGFHFPKWENTISMAASPYPSSTEVF